MPYIPDVHTNDQIAAAGWGNLIRNATVIHVASIAERNTYTGVAALDQIVYVTQTGEFFIKGATGWLTLLSKWRTYPPLVFVATGGTQFYCWVVPGQGNIGSPFALDPISSFRYRLELDTCHFMAAAVFTTPWTGGAGAGMLQVGLPDFPMAVHNVPAGQGQALAYWNSAGTERSKWMGGGCFAIKNDTLVRNQNLFNGAYIGRVQEDALTAVNVSTETGGAGYLFPSSFGSHKAGMYVNGEFQMTGLAPG